MRNFIIIWVMVVAALILFGTIFPDAPEETNLALVPMIAITAMAPTNTVPAYDPISCVVVINTTQGMGSGTLVSEDGVILTAGHVLQGRILSVTSSSGYKWTEFEDVYHSTASDVGLFRLKGVSELPHLQFGDAHALIPGDKLWAIGVPFGFYQWRCYGRVAKDCSKGKLYLSMPLNPGNSGCPILNYENVIVGICTMGIPRGNNMSFGHTSNLCVAVLAQYNELYGHGSCYGVN
jgi:serine protease Do